MRLFIIASLLLLLACVQIEAQTDSIAQHPMDENNFSTMQESTPLLPNKYPITQRIFWGEKGLMRNINYFKLTEEKRAREMEIRRVMITSHRYLGYATLGGMIAEGIVGAKLYNGDNSVRGLHEGLAAAVNIGYFTTAGLALFAPPRMKDRPKGISAVKIHKALSIVHLSSMIATNILAGSLENNPSLKPYHRAAAFTAFGSFFVSMVVINL